MSATRSLRQRSKVDYSEKVKKHERYHYIKKTPKDKKRKSMANKSETKPKKRKADKKSPQQTKENKENLNTLNVTKKAGKVLQKQKKTATKTGNATPKTKTTQASSKTGLREKKALKIATPRNKAPAKATPQTKFKTEAYEKLWKEHKQLRADQKALQSQLAKKVDNATSAKYIQQLEMKVEEISCKLADKNAKVKELRNKLNEVTDGAKTSAAGKVKRELELMSIIDAYKLVTSTRIQQKGTGIFKCRSINREEGRVMDFDLVIGDEEVEFVPKSSDLESLPEMFQESIEFDVDQTPKFMQLLLKSMY